MRYASDDVHVALLPHRPAPAPARPLTPDDVAPLAAEALNDPVELVALGTEEYDLNVILLYIICNSMPIQLGGREGGQAATASSVELVALEAKGDTVGKRIQTPV